MTTLAPPPLREGETRSAATEPAAARVAGRTVVAATLAALLLTALLNCDDLVRTARRLPFGTERTVALALADANRDVSHALWLDRPRHALDRLFGNAPAGQPIVTPPVPAPTIAPPTTPPTTGPTTGPTTAPTTPVQSPAPTAAHPLRIYLGGDSVADQVGEGIVGLAASTRVITVDADARISTGLTRPDYFDWTGRLRQVLARRTPPQVVIVMFGANDVQPIMTPSGPASVGTTRWLTEYRRRVDATMTLLARSGTDVYWVGQPLMRSSYFNARIGELDQIYATEAARHPGIRFVDVRPVLADTHGNYAAYLPDSDGEAVQVRAADGVHLTVAGARLLGGYVLRLVRQRWSIPSR